MSYSDLWLEHSDLAKRNLSLLEEIVVFEWHVSWIELAVWGTMVLFEASKLFTLFALALDDSSEIPSGKETVVWHNMIECSWFVIMVVLEAGSI